MSDYPHDKFCNTQRSENECDCHVAEIERLTAENDSAYLAGYELAHGFKLTDRERARLLELRAATGKQE